MAKIVLNDEAPKEKIHFSFGAEEFDLDVSGSHQTDDGSLIAEAEGHPWLEVKVEAEAPAIASTRVQSTPPVVVPSDTGDNS